MASSLAVQAYDTLSIARNLEQDYALEKQQAEGIARTIHEHLASNVATKEDLKNFGAELRSEIRAESAKLRGEFQAEINEVRAEMAEMRVEMANINNRIDNLAKTLTIRTGAMIVAAVGAMSALQALIG